MIQKFLAKYGLAVHLAILAAAPVALTPFFTAATQGSVILWLSVFAAVWLFLEPSLRAGEHLSEARARVRGAILRDPFFWMCLVGLVYAAFRACNTGLELFFDAEKSVWCIHEPKFPVLPSSHGDAGFLPFCMLLALTLVTMGVRHGVGRNARTLLCVFGSFCAGLGGLVASTLAVLGKAPFNGWISAAFDKAPFWPSLFGVWLVLGLVGCAQAEARQWGKARLFYIVGLAGTSSVLVFFAPPLVAAAWLVFAVGIFAFSLVHLGHVASSGSVARAFVLAVLGLGVSVFLLVFLPEADRSLKLDLIDPTLALGKSYDAVCVPLSRIAKKMWLQNPWLGTGLDAFALNLNFLADKSDWAVLPRQVSTAFNGYWMLIAERGILGALLLLVGAGFLFVTWILRCIAAWRYLQKRDDADVFVFAVQPLVWTTPFFVALFLVEALWSPLLTETAFPLVLATALALAATDFPRPRHGSSSEESDAHPHSES